MKSVSYAYKDSMKALLRNRSFVRITFGNVDTSASTDGQWASNGALAISDFETVDYEFEYQKSYATLELNHWALDGKTQIAPVSGFKDGFISQFMSDENGDFTTAAVITRQFSQSHDFPGLTLTFDSRRNEWSSSVTVDFYSNNEVVDHKEVICSGTTVIINTKAENIDKVVISFGSGLPYRRPRLEAVLYGVNKQFNNKDIVSTRQNHDVDPLSRRLPIEQMQFTVLDYEHNYDPDSPTGIYAYVDKNSPVKIQFGYELPDGTVEWIKEDKYVLNARPQTKNNKATFKGTGLIGSMNGMFYKSKLGRKNFYDMAEEVLQDANLTPSEEGTNPWDIDESLKQMFTTAALPIATHTNCLQLIAHACRCRLFTDDDNIIHIKPFGVTVRGIYNGIWEDNGHLPYSDWESVDKGNSFGNTYATLELNRWVLDGKNQVLLDEEEPSGRGFIGEPMSNVDGSFTETPMFSKTFDVSHDLPVLALRFDVPLNEYPTAIKVRYYNGSTLLDTKMVNNINSPEVFVNSELAIDCTKFDVSMYGNLPYRRMRVGKVYYRETDFTLDFSSISENTQEISKIDQLKAVTVAKYSYSADTEASVLFEGQTTDTSLHVEFSGMAQDVQISVTGGTLVSSKIYARAADLTLSSGNKNIVITGKTVDESSVVFTYPVNAEGEVDKEKNPLITEDAMCTALADHIKKYLLMRNTYSAKYRGNPELEVGDIIGLQTPYTSEIDGLILVDEITFNGSLSGRMKVKGLI